MKLKPIRATNDYVAILRTLDVPDGIEVDKEMMEKISNEGVVVGVGPEATECVSVGDVVIFQNKRYLVIQPQSGGYENKQVLFARKMDVLAIIGKSEKYEIE